MYLHSPFCLKQTSARFELNVTLSKKNSDEVSSSLFFYNRKSFTRFQLPKTLRAVYSIFLIGQFPKCARNCSCPQHCLL